MRSPATPFVNPFSLSDCQVPKYLESHADFFARFGQASRVGRTLAAILAVLIRGDGLLEGLILRTTIIMDEIIRHYLLYPVVRSAFEKTISHKPGYCSDPYYFFVKHINTIARMFHQVTFSQASGSAMRMDFRTLAESVSTRHLRAVKERVETMETVVASQRGINEMSLDGKLMYDYTSDALVCMKAYHRCVSSYNEAVQRNNSGLLPSIMSRVMEICRIWRQRLHSHRYAYQARQESRAAIRSLGTIAVPELDIVQDYQRPGNENDLTCLLRPIRPIPRERSITQETVNQHTVEYTGCVDPSVLQNVQAVPHQEDPEQTACS